MTDEKQVASLLSRAAELSDLAPAPVEQLVARGRRRRRGHRIISAIVAVTAVTGAAVLLALARDSGNGTAFPAATGPVTARRSSAGPGSTAASLERGRWSVLPASPLGRRSQPEVAWTGSELIEIGGLAGNVARGDGAAFEPGRAGWHQIATAPLTVGTAGAVTVWTGSRLFLFGGQGQPSTGAYLGPAGGLYDPVTNSWAVTAAAPLSARLQQPAAVWTGRVIVVAGISNGTVQAASYNPVTGAWRPISPPLPAAHPAERVALATAGGRVVLWSMWGRARKTEELTGMDVRVLPSGGHWQDMAGWPLPFTVLAPLTAGSRVLIPGAWIWCGDGCTTPVPYDLHAYLLDPATLGLTRVPHGPLDDAQPVVIWTGAAVIEVDLGTVIQGGGINVQPRDMAVWDPASGRWHGLPRAPRQLPDGSLPTWAGTRLLVIGASGALVAFGR